MDLAQTLIRSVVRSFYSTEHILVIDAVLLHSAIRDDELGIALGIQTKQVRKYCAKLRDDGLLAVHSQQQQREGQTRSFTKDFYYIDVHYAIDAIKFRIKNMSKDIERKYGQKVEEKKEFHCPRCKNEYTQMQLLDAAIDGTGNFVCKRCGEALEDIEDGNSNGGPLKHTGHEMQARLNKQLAPFEELMQKIDTADVPENDWDTAFAKLVPVKRDSVTNPGAKTTVVDAPIVKTVKGLKQDQAEEVIIEADVSPEERERIQKQREAEKAAQQEKNALPEWHTNSTVAPSAAAGASTSATNGISAKRDVDEDKPLASQPSAPPPAAATDDFFRQLEQESSSEEEDDDDDSDDDDDDEDDDNEQPPAKRAKTGDGEKSSEGNASKATSQADAADDSSDDSD